MASPAVVPDDQPTSPAPPRKPPMARRVVLCLAVLCLVLLAAAAWVKARSASGRSLLQKARPVAVWKRGMYSYAWVSDREILRVESAAPSAGLRIVRVDTTSGTEAPVKALDKPLGSITAGLGAAYPGLYADPRWLVIDGSTPNPATGWGRPQSFLLDTSTGRHMNAGPLFRRATACPMPDDRHWLSLPMHQSNPTLGLYRADGKALALERTARVEGQGLGPGGVDGVLGVGADGRIVAWAEGQGADPAGRLYALTLAGRTARAERLPTPVGGTGTSRSVVVLSPDGRRVLVMEADDRFPGRTLTQQTGQWLAWRRGAGAVARLWVGTLNSGERQDLGAVESGPWDCPDGLRWTPDGKAVTFTFDGRIWRLPVP